MEWTERLPAMAAAATLLLLTACGRVTGSDGGSAFATPYPEGPDVARAVFAGGCFWCMEPPFEKLDGVHEVVSGYAGGTGGQPAYNDVAAGRTDFLEAVEVAYDPGKITYAELLDVFWRNIDPTQDDGQFADRGPQYRTAIFVATDRQRRAAEKSKDELAASGRFDDPIVTEIREATAFFPAEEYHQDYYKKNPAHYNAYRVGSGRAGFIRRAWAAE